VTVTQIADLLKNLSGAENPIKTGTLLRTHPPKTQKVRAQAVQGIFGARAGTARAPESEQKKKGRLAPPFREMSVA